MSLENKAGFAEMSLSNLFPVGYSTQGGLEGAQPLSQPLLIIVRKNILCEHFGAYLWHKYAKAKVIVTDPLTKMDEKTLEKIQDKNILIVGGYYKDNMDEIYARAKSVEVFYNNDDLQFQSTDKGKVTLYKTNPGTTNLSIISYRLFDEKNKYKYILESDTQDTKNNVIYVADEHTGFATYSIETLGIEQECYKIMATRFDSYLYGFPSEKTLMFQYGFYSLEMKEDMDKFKAITENPNLIENILLIGQKTRLVNATITKQRLENSTEVAVDYQGKEYKMRIAVGDSPIVDSCILLADNATDGIGCLIRFNLQTKKIFYSIRKSAKADPNLKMGDFIREVFGCGGGSKIQAGGAKDVNNIEQLFNFMGLKR